MKCVICGKDIKGFGNNAEPLKPGECCDECNNHKVLPLRLFLAGVIKDQIMILNTDAKEPVYKDVKGKEVALKELQDIVKGYIEVYPSRDKNNLYIVNEEGLIHHLPVNQLAWDILGIEVYGNMAICPRCLFK